MKRNVFAACGGIGAGVLCGVLIAVLALLTGCAGLPTLEPTPTELPTLTPVPTETQLPTLEPTPGSVGTVEITGNVWMRDSANTQISVLMAGTRVNAICSGEWCNLQDSEGATDFKFWRGCSDNNPDSLACTMAD